MKTEELKEEIEKSNKMQIKEALKRGSKLTSEQILYRSAKQIKNFTDNFWIYNKFIAEAELKGRTEAIEDEIKFLEDVLIEGRCREDYGEAYIRMKAIIENQIIELRRKNEK